MRYLFLLLPLALSACATGAGTDGGIQVETTSRGQALAGAVCVVKSSTGTSSITTPGRVVIGNARGDLSVVCDKPGYRTSEFVYRPASGSGSNVGIGLGGGGGHAGIGLGLNFPISVGAGAYPSRVTVDMNPL